MTGRVLVSGCRGFIGAHLVRRLLEAGYEVVGADLERGDVEGVEYHICDVTDYSDFMKLPDDLDAVIHLAGISFVPRADSDITRTYDVNFMGAYNALKYCLKCGAETFIFASSSKVYGKPKYLPLDEKHQLNPQNTYGRSKKAAEDVICALAQEGAGSVNVLRQFNIYGPDQAGEFFMPTVLSQLRQGSELRLGNLNVKRDFLYVDDLADAYLLLLKKKPTGFNTFNIGGGKAYSLRDVVGEAAKIFGRAPKVKVDARKVRSEVKEIYSCNRKIGKLGWKPKTSLKRGLEAMVEAGC